MPHCRLTRARLHLGYAPVPVPVGMSSCHAHPLSVRGGAQGERVLSVCLRECAVCMHPIVNSGVRVTERQVAPKTNERHAADRLAITLHRCFGLDQTSVSTGIFSLVSCYMYSVAILRLRTLPTIAEPWLRYRSSFAPNLCRRGRLRLCSGSQSLAHRRRLLHLQPPGLRATAPNQTTTTTTRTTECLVDRMTHRAQPSAPSTLTVSIHPRCEKGRPSCSHLACR